MHSLHGVRKILSEEGALTAADLSLAGATALRLREG